VRNRRILRTLPWAISAWAVYWLALFVSTHVPRLPSVDGPVGWDKAAHFFGYAGLAVLTCLALLRGRRWTWRAALAVLVGLLVYGVVDELLQIPIPRRSADPADWTADALGAVAGMMLFRAVQKTVELVQQARRRESGLVLEQV
jgi:VanZ family protein